MTIHQSFIREFHTLFITVDFLGISLNRSIEWDDPLNGCVLFSLMMRNGYQDNPFKICYYIWYQKTIKTLHF